MTKPELVLQNKRLSNSNDHFRKEASDSKKAYEVMEGIRDGLRKPLKELRGCTICVPKRQKNDGIG